MTVEIRRVKKSIPRCWKLTPPRMNAKLETFVCICIKTAWCLAEEQKATNKVQQHKDQVERVPFKQSNTKLQRNQQK